MKPITVHITEDDIAFGQQRNNARCAAVLAIKAADPEIERVIVTRDKITFSHRGDEQRYTLPAPRRLARFVDKFDTDDGPAQVAPMTFIVDPAQAVKVKPMQHATNGAERLKHRAEREPGTGRGRVSYRPPVGAGA